jgi:hypothetical protein
MDLSDNAAIEYWQAENAEKYLIPLKTTFETPKLQATISKAPNHNTQITNKSQIPSSNDPNV